MKTDLTQITYDAKQLAAQVKDLPSIARHINRVHKTNYQAGDIEKIIAGIKPTASVPHHHPITKIKLSEPIAWTPPISTSRNGSDPLAIACLEYGIKHGGVMGASVKDCRVMLKAMGR